MFMCVYWVYKQSESGEMMCLFVCVRVIFTSKWSLLNPVKNIMTLYIAFMLYIYVCMCISISLQTWHTLCSYAICVMLMSEYSHKLNVHSRHCNLSKFPCQRSIHFFRVYIFEFKLPIIRMQFAIDACSMLNNYWLQTFSDLNCSKHGSKLIKIMFGVAEFGCIDFKQQYCGVYHRDWVSSENDLFKTYQCCMENWLVLWMPFVV